MICVIHKENEEARVRTWLVCKQCRAKELLTKRSKFYGGCLHCGGGPRTAENDKGEPMLVWSVTDDVTSWDLPKSEQE